MKDMFRVRTWLLWTVLAWSATGVRASESGKPWIRGVYTGESPRPLVTEEDAAWKQASYVAEYTSRAFVLMGMGQSMRPLYEAGTILVLRQMPYDQLKRGQTVMYRNRQDKAVAHVLVSRSRDGWRAQGLNNPTHDMEPIRPENLVGVVIAACQPSAPRPQVGLAAMP